MLTAGRSDRIAEKLVQTDARSGKIRVRFGLTSASIDMIAAREPHDRNYARIGLRSGVIGERSAAIVASFVGIDATCVRTFVIFEAIVGMLSGVEPAKKIQSGTTQLGNCAGPEGRLAPLRLIGLQISGGKPPFPYVKISFTSRFFFLRDSLATY